MYSLRNGATITNVKVVSGADKLIRPTAPAPPAQ